MTFERWETCSGFHARSGSLHGGTSQTAHKDTKSNRELWSHASDKAGDAQGPGRGQRLQGMLLEGRDCSGKGHQQAYDGPVESVARHQVSCLRLSGLVAATGCEWRRLWKSHISGTTWNFTKR